MEIIEITKHPENIISEYTRKQLMDEGAPAEYINKCIYIEQMIIDHRDAGHFAVEDFSVEEMEDEYERIEKDLDNLSREQLVRICRSRAYAEPEEISFRAKVREKTIYGVKSEYILELASKKDILSDDALFEKIRDLVIMEEQVLGHIKIGYDQFLYETDVDKGDYIHVKRSLRGYENLDPDDPLHNAESEFIIEQVNKMDDINEEKLYFIDTLIDIENHILKGEDINQATYEDTLSCHTRFLEFSIRQGLENSFDSDHEYVTLIDEIPTWSEDVKDDKLDLIKGDGEIQKSDYATKRIIEKGSKSEFTEKVTEFVGHLNWGYQPLDHWDFGDTQTENYMKPVTLYLLENHIYDLFRIMYETRPDDFEERNLLTRYRNLCAGRDPNQEYEYRDRKLASELSNQEIPYIIKNMYDHLTF